VCLRVSLRGIRRRAVARAALVALGASLLSLAAPAPRAAAEEAPADPDLSLQDTHRAGPFHIRPFVLLKDAGYDDNIRFDASRPEGDTTATAGAGLSALLLTGDRGGLYTSQEVDYVAFGRNTDLNHWNGSARGRGILLLKHLVLSLEDAFRSERERPNTEIDQRLRRQNNGVSGALRTRGTGRLALTASLRRERIDYRTGDPAAADVPDRLNRDEDRLAVAGELRVRPKTTFILEGRVERIAFDDASQGRDSRKRTLLPGFRFDPSSFLSGELRLGVTRLTALDFPDSDFSGTVGETALSARLGSSSRLKGTYERDLVFSVLPDNLYYVGTSWKAAFEQFFSRRLSGEVAYGRGLNHYPNETTRAGVDPFQGIRDDRLTTYQAGVRYRLNDQLSLALTAYRLNRDSTDDFYDRQRNLYTLGTVYNF
jgi:Putative beta-barrel porin 2